MADRMLGAIRGAIPDADVLCIEDYAKGVCTPELCAAAIDAAREVGVPVFVDPAKLTDYSRYRGCTTITPNRTEAEHATGLATHHADNPDECAAHNAQLARTLAGACSAARPWC